MEDDALNQRIQNYRKTHNQISKAREDHSLSLRKRRLDEIISEKRRLASSSLQVNPLTLNIKDELKTKIVEDLVYKFYNLC